MNDRVLQPHELAERGLEPIFGPSAPLEKEIQMDLRTNRQSGATFMPTEDVTKTLEDGRQIQIAVAGVPMPLAAAIDAGLADEQGQPVAQAKPAKAVGPAEVKEGDGEASKPSEKK